MKRIYEEELESWIKAKNRKPLIVRGARQVGKSTLIRNFSTRLGLTLFEVNLEKQKQLEPVFQSLKIPEIILELEILCNKGSLGNPDTLLFLDEIQATPSALAALRYFYEERPEIAVIAAGSLLEFTLSDHTFSMPVGRVEYFHVSQLSFIEFAEACGEGQLASYLSTYTLGDSFSATAHDKACSLLRTYLLTGGMPEAVDDFRQNRNAGSVTRIHNRIIDTLRDDFGKYASGAVLKRIQRVFDFVPTALGRKLKSTQVDPDWKAADIRAAFDHLAKARLCIPAFHSSCAGIPIEGLRDEKIMKPYFVDVGLSNTLCGIQGVSFDQFAKLLFVNEGAMAEQFVAQHLLHAHGPYTRPTLFYWLRESRTNNAEVDFVMQIGTRIVPVEVKSASAGSLKSVHQFVAEKGVSTALRFDINPPSIQDVTARLTSKDGKTVRFKLITLPLYLAGQIVRLVSEAA